MYYVINVKAGNEEKTIESIHRQIGAKQGIELFSPYRKSIRKYKGIEKECIERCFPGYVFVETDKPKDLFDVLYWVPEYTKLLGREGLTNNFVPLDEEESRMIDILYSKNSNRITEISDIELEEGQVIKVLDGPLMGIEASITKINLHKRTVTINFLLCGRDVSAQLAINIITKSNKNN